MPLPDLRFDAAADRHGISRTRSAYVIRHCGLPFEGVRDDNVILYLGDDWNGVPLEVGAVERAGELVVIHAMALRPDHAFQDLYLEALPWRK